jgi:hypothetical protein
MTSHPPIWRVVNVSLRNKASHRRKKRAFDVARKSRNKETIEREVKQMLSKRRLKYTTYINIDYIEYNAMTIMKKVFMVKKHLDLNMNILINF